MILITGASGFIGTNLIELFETKRYEFINFDKNPPTKQQQLPYWHQGNIMNTEELKMVFEQYKPEIIIHLAARTDTLSNKLEDYVENYKGTENIVNTIKQFNCVKHALFASTQYVYKNTKVPFGPRDNSYAPHTVYGLSKKMGEETVRYSEMSCKWTIFRPCNVWGPWHMRYPIELWKMIAKGWYIHPSKKPVIRTYAYVKNLCHQLDAIINAESSVVDKKTFYLGDVPIDSYIWLNAISKEIRKKDIKRIPRFFFIFGAIIGDIIRKFGYRFPLYSMRYKNMVEDFYAPSIVSIHLFGIYNDNYNNNVKETIDWLRIEGVKIFPEWKKYLK